MNHRSAWLNPEEAQAAIARGKGRGIKIAVIDSGVDISHPQLQHLRLVDDLAFDLSENNIITRSPGWAKDVVGHGTAIAAVINRCAPEAQIGSFRVLDRWNDTKFRILREAAEMALDLGYNILNCSFGSSVSKAPIEHFKPWIDAAYRHGVHVVSACDNYNFRNAEWPGHFPSVITVNMAKTQGDEILFRWDLPKQREFASHLVEFAARGMNLELPWKDGKMKEVSGSSIAAPHVAGLLARLLSEYPDLKPPVAKALLQEVASPWDPIWTATND